MELKGHLINGKSVGEVISQAPVITTIEDGIDLLGNVYYQGFDAVILHEKDIATRFFDLKTQMAGEILQKFSNYRIPLIIVGDFGKYESKSLQDFIRESNQGKQVSFVASVEEAIMKIS